MINTSRFQLEGNTYTAKGDLPALVIWGYWTWAFLGPEHCSEVYRLQGRPHFECYSFIGLLYFTDALSELIAHSPCSCVHSWHPNIYALNVSSMYTQCIASLCMEMGGNVTAEGRTILNSSPSSTGCCYFFYYFCVETLWCRLLRMYLWMQNTRLRTLPLFDTERC